jgi:hypothetical protein
VLCNGDHRFEDDPVALWRIVHGGYGVALWRRRPHQPDAACGEFHRRVGDTIAEAGSAERLPEVVHALRVGLRAGLRETFWADGIALFYDDPSRPGDPPYRAPLKSNCAFAAPNWAAASPSYRTWSAAPPPPRTPAHPTPARPPPATQRHGGRRRRCRS